MDIAPQIGSIGLLAYIGRDYCLIMDEKAKPKHRRNQELIKKYRSEMKALYRRLDATTKTKKGEQ